MSERENVVWVGAAGFEADNDRVIILQDSFRSGFECPTCLDEVKHTVAGREVSTIACPSCEGEKTRPKAGNPNIRVKCSECGGEGWIVCPECQGKGGRLVLAENTKGRPTTGTIVSIGPDVKNRVLGDKVIYPSFAGHAYDLSAVNAKGKLVEVVLVILRDSEILSRMYGSLEQNQVKRAEARYTNA